MRALLAFVALVFALGASGQSQITKKDVPPVAGKAKTSDKNREQTNRKQEVTVEFPTSFNVTVGGKVDVVSEQKQAEANNEPSKWTDPVTWFTCILAAANILLWLSTRKIAKEATVASGIAGAAAQAAKESAGVAKDALTLTQRAFVFSKGIDVGINTTDHQIKEYVFLVHWENVGNTPAIDVRSWIYFDQIPVNETREPLFAKKDVGTSMVLGPRSAPIESVVTIPLATMMECWRDKTKVFIWARVEYRDILSATTSIHHHEQCARVQVIHDPSDIPPPGHRPYAMLITYGPQNSAS